MGKALKIYEDSSYYQLFSCSLQVSWKDPRRKFSGNVHIYDEIVLYLWRNVVISPNVHVIQLKPLPMKNLKPFLYLPFDTHFHRGEAAFHRGQRTNENAQNSQLLFYCPIGLRPVPMHCGMIFFRWQKRVILNNKMSAKWSKLGVFTTWFLWDFGMEQTLGLDAV